MELFFLEAIAETRLFRVPDIKAAAFIGAGVFQVNVEVFLYVVLRDECERAIVEILIGTRTEDRRPDNVDD